MSWQALAARLDGELEADDESWVAVSAAYRHAYQRAVTIIEPRLLARVDALVAVGGAYDQLITDSEWAGLLGLEADDAVGDTVNDGLIAIMILLGISIPDHTLDQAVAPHLDHTADFLRSSLDDFITANQDRGWSPDEWLQGLRSGSSPLSPDRAERWARTQANGAVNAGYWNGLDACNMQNSAALAEYECSEVAAIRWVTQRDEKVRPAHKAVDRDTILLGELFSVDGHPARHPGDPFLPIGLRINCRCHLAWVDGTEVRRIIGARYRDLYARARELNIRGRSKMRKAELQTAILEELCLQGLAGGPDCPDLFEQMNKATLMTHARREGIVGRWRMNRPELIENLRATMRGSDRLRIAEGYVPRNELDQAQRLARTKRVAAAKLTSIATGDLPEVAARRASREALFAEFGGVAQGHVPCVFCGLKLNPVASSGLAVLVPTPIVPLSQGGVLAAANMLPGCTACFSAHGTFSTVALAASGAPEQTEEFDGDPDEGVNLAWWRDRLLSSPARRIRDTFHLKGTANDHDQSTHAGGSALEEAKENLVPGRYYKRDEYPALTSEDDVYKAGRRWAYDAKHSEMAEAAERAVRGQAIRATADAVLGVGLLNGMDEAPKTEVPHYRGLPSFDPERGVGALTAATPELDLAFEYLRNPNVGRATLGGGALIRFEPGTPFREAFGGSFAQTEESIVSGEFEFTETFDLLEGEARWDNATGEATRVYSAVWKGPAKADTEEFHLQGQHDQKSHGNRGGGRRANVADYDKWTTIDGPNGRFDVQPGIFPNSARVTYHSDGNEKQIAGQEDVTLDLMFEVDADGNILGVTVDDRYQYGDEEYRHPTHKRDAIALIKDHFDDANVTGPDWDQDPGELYRTPLGQALGAIGGFKVGDEEFRIEFDEGSSGVKGQIIDVETGETAGGFEREFDGETLYNQKLTMVPWYRGRGIGTTFADTLESAMAEHGAERTALTAADVGKYAWAARGYEATDVWFDPEDYEQALEAYSGDGDWSTNSTATGWLLATRTHIDNNVMGNTRTAALERLDRIPNQWEFDGVYPGYLVGVDPDIAKIVLMDGPQWKGTRYIADSYPWEEVATGPIDAVDEPDPNQLLLPLAASGTLYLPEIMRELMESMTRPIDPNVKRQSSMPSPINFHLQGQHDQKSHGNRGGVSGALILDKTNADRAWADREGNNRLSGQGDCYVAAYQAMETGPRHRLVHGVVAGQGDLEGVRFDHAWVERRDELPSGTVDRFSPEQIAMLNEANVMVIDRSNGNNIEMPRQLYYAIGQVDSDTVARYTYEEMARNMVEYKHYGPWDGDHTHDT